MIIGMFLIIVILGIINNVLRMRTNYQISVLEAKLKQFESVLKIRFSTAELKMMMLESKIEVNRKP